MLVDEEPAVECDEFDEALIQIISPKTVLKYILAKDNAPFIINIYVSAEASVIDMKLLCGMYVDGQEFGVFALHDKEEDNVT